MTVFKLIQADSQTKARAGELYTMHGVVATPVFLPVGSQASVKTLTPDDLYSFDYKMILANTYHLYLRPGIDVIKDLGGLHKFMAWNGAILTDSGGYQVFSLAPLRRVTDEGVVFRSHVDGSDHLFTPELAIKYEEDLGADVIMVLDECSPHDASYDQVRSALHRTHRWAQRCLDAHKANGQLLFAIIQGGLFLELRQESVAALTAMNFPGYAIGGLSLGEPKKVMYDVVDRTVDLLPAEKPRYLMGVGSPEDIMEGVARGVDVFDSALPTRIARNGALLTWQGRKNIRNAGFARAAAPIDEKCNCFTCRTFSAAYLHHLFKAGEILGLRLATIHNLFFMKDLMNKIRENILSGTFSELLGEFSASYKPTDEKVRLDQKSKWLRARTSKKTE